jgi:hypothetical protein
VLCLKLYSRLFYLTKLLLRNYLLKHHVDLGKVGFFELGENSSSITYKESYIVALYNVIEQQETKVSKLCKIAQKTLHFRATGLGLLYFNFGFQNTPSLFTSEYSCTTGIIMLNVKNIL